MYEMKPWASSVLGLLRPLLAAAAALVWLHLLVADGAKIGLPGCTTICGNVSVPYPFGFEPGCSLKGFNLTCDVSRTPPKLFIMDTDTVTEISLDDSTVLYFAPLREGLAPTSKQLINDDDQQSMPSGGLFSAGEQRFDWMLVSSALQEPNKTRAGNATCPKDLGATACHSTHSTCQAITATGPIITGYTCRCDDGYQGNAYLSDGCQDVDRCSFPDKLCFGNCTNFPGSKYLCQCPEGTIGDPYTLNGCVKPRDPKTGLIIGLGVGSGVILLFLVLSTIFVIHRIMTRKKRMRQRFFKQNRGQLLQQLVCQRADIGERMILTLEELEKATNNFDKARELGGGGHGIVYKGILSTLHVVAIKKAKIVIQREIDDFINELVILSQINHRNIVKLHGCCLETEVPLLVYEFISNGTLYNHLHVETLVSLSWKDRVRIAVEAARAITYLHSLTSMPIIHRDVKSPNILLDDNLTVKLSDFGASRYIPIDQTGLDTTVQGTFGYLDPTYHSTGHLTEKSDVYSFGVILIELLTRKKPVSYRSSNGYGLVRHFTTLLSEHNLVDILDPQVVREGAGEVIDISLLAAMCVKFVSKDRPTMRQVEMTLESIHAVKEYALSDMTDESEENYNQVNNMRIEGINNDTGIHDGLRELREIITDESNDGTTLVANISQKCG
ncbi:putative wall-associated receptor kinase-like 16 [Miscanthus floridulus]|uniref:putative wall-associated receptor kinase-like 16 n=1 Tax=Miscanthus floridulus TaxID=154761 RepID=UPI003457FAE1